MWYMFFRPSVEEFGEEAALRGLVVHGFGIEADTHGHTLLLGGDGRSPSIMEREGPEQFRHLPNLVLMWLLLGFSLLQLTVRNIPHHTPIGRQPRLSMVGARYRTVGWQLRQCLHRRAADSLLLALRRQWVGWFGIGGCSGHSCRSLVTLCMACLGGGAVRCEPVPSPEVALPHRMRTGMAGPGRRSGCHVPVRHRPVPHRPVPHRPGLAHASVV